MYFNQGSYFYYIVLALNIFCVIHMIRRGTVTRWIWLVIFIPIIGSLVYIYYEVLPNRRIDTSKIDLGAMLNPGSKLKKLEDEMRFTDTFANKVKLADTYLASGYTDKAIELYESSMAGAFVENEYVMAQLVIAYYDKQEYEPSITMAQKIYKLPQFARSKAHLLYARSLENTGNVEQAETEFKLMKGRFSYFQQRYEYGQFLLRAGRDQEAANMFTEMLNEEKHLGSVERRTSREWFAKAKDGLRRIPVS
jgi:hypothetical protein